MPFTYPYPRAALTVDCVVFGFDEGALKILLIRRGIEPFKNRWALPGGFVQPDETLDAAARRELQEETGLRDVYQEQLYTFGEINPLFPALRSSPTAVSGPPVKSKFLAVTQTAPLQFS
jgi:8-oxo-dGTP diphosphatase